jgi:hypothetical protein
LIPYIRDIQFGRIFGQEIQENFCAKRSAGSARPCENKDVMAGEEGILARQVAATKATV